MWLPDPQSRILPNAASKWAPLLWESLHPDSNLNHKLFLKKIIYFCTIKLLKTKNKNEKKIFRVFFFVLERPHQLNRTNEILKAF